MRMRYAEPKIFIDFFCQPWLTGMTIAKFYLTWPFAKITSKNCPEHTVSDDEVSAVSSKAEKLGLMIFIFGEGPFEL